MAPLPHNKGLFNSTHTHTHAFPQAFLLSYRVCVPQMCLTQYISCIGKMIRDIFVSQLPQLRPVFHYNTIFSPPCFRINYPVAMLHSSPHLKFAREETFESFPGKITSRESSFLNVERLCVLFR